MIEALLKDTLRFIQESVDLEELLPANKPFRGTPQRKITPPPFLTPPPLKEEPIVKTEVLEPPLKPTLPHTPLEVHSLSKAVKTLFPHFATHEELSTPHALHPSLKKVLQAETVLLCFREGKESDLFLQNLQIALSAYFSSAAVLDVGKWEKEQSSFEPFFKQIQAKLILSSSSLYKRPSLLPFLKEIPSSLERFLGSSRLLLLQPFEHYFTNPQAKKELWNAICAILKNTRSTPA
jgi:hypothetical protein